MNVTERLLISWSQDQSCGFVCLLA